MSRLVLLIALALGACERGVIPEDAGAQAGSTGQGLGGDTSDPEGDGAGGADTVVGEDAPVDAAAPEAALEVGTNVTGKNTPSAFTPLPEGADIQVELGFQGAYMVVLAFRSRGYPTKKLTVRGSVGASGKTLGAIALKGKTTMKAPDGWSYFYNLFVITEGWEELIDGPATATVTLEDGDGAVLVSRSVKGTLRGP